MRAGGVAAVSPNGILGDPTGASADEGHALLAAITAAVTAAIRTWAPDEKTARLPF
jgi:creatinine amidohydrolase